MTQNPRLFGAITFTLVLAAGCGAEFESDLELGSDTATTEDPLRLANGEYGGCGGGTPETAANPELEVLAAQILQRTNQYRAQNGLPGLEAEGCLAWIAYEHAVDFKEYRTQPNDPHRTLDGKGPIERVRDSGIAYTSVYENMVYDCRRLNGQPVYESNLFAQRAVDWWISSPPHRTNLLRRDARYLGVGVTKGPRGTDGCYFATQLFLDQ